MLGSFLAADLECYSPVFKLAGNYTGIKLASNFCHAAGMMQANGAVLVYDI